MESAEQMSALNLRAVLDTSPIGAGISDVETGAIKYVNKRSLEVLGLKREKFAGEPAKNFWAGQADRERFIEAYRRDGRVSGEVQLKKADGTLFWCDLTWESSPYLADEVIFWINDISELKDVEIAHLKVQAELEKEVFERTHELEEVVEKLSAEIAKRERGQKELERTEQTLLDVIQDSPVAVGITDKSGNYQFWNPLFYNMGRQVVNDVGRNEFRVSFKNPKAYVALLERLEREGSVTNQEVELFDKDDVETWGLVSMQKMEFEGDAATLTWIYDITELKTQEAALTEARIEAEDANRAKSSFLAQMSHEIRTPMNGVMTMADLMALTPLTKEQAGMNQIIYESSRTLLAIINDILDFSKIEAGKIDIESAAFSLTGVVEGVVELLAPTAFEKGLELIVFVDPNIPDHLEGDPVRLRQVLTNFLSNAVKFTETGRVAVHVSLLEVVGTTANVQFKITDTGIGLSQDQASKLFSPFQQADATIARRFGGTGLGLTISRSLINLMGGDVQVESSLGGGSTFSFELRFSIQTEQRSIMDHDLTGIHIIAVAADPVITEVISRYLEFLNAECATARSFEETATLMQENERSKRKVDAIINLDWACKSFWTQALDTMVQEWADQGIVLICAGMHPGGGRFEAEQEGGRIIIIARHWKREIICQTIAGAVGRADEAKPKHDFHRMDDVSSDVFYSAPSIEVATEQGTLILVAEDNLTNQIVIELVMERLGFAAEIVLDGAEALKKLEEKSYGLLLTDCHMPVKGPRPLFREPIRDRARTSPCIGN